jgi:hypothetical protein
MGGRAAATVDQTWLQSLGAMIDGGARIQAVCTVCRRFKRFTKDELMALAERVGRDYRLINRRCRCRLKPGCDGWNRFYYLSGVYRPLWEEDRIWSR